jgi:hypothetical protein
MLTRADPTLDRPMILFQHSVWRGLLGFGGAMIPWGGFKRFLGGFRVGPIGIN